MAADIVSVLVAEEFFVTVPVPEMTPDSVWSLDDEYTNAALFTMLELKLFGLPDPSDPAPVTASVPEVTVSVPAKVFAPESASVPAASLVSAKFPDTTPDKVPVLPEATLTLDADAIAAAPDIVAVSEKYTAPFVAEVPLIVSGSAELNEPSPATSSVAPESTTVP